MVSSILIPLITYCLVLIIGVPHEQSHALRYEFSLSVELLAVLVLYLVLRIPRLIGRILALSLTFVLFALPLSALWNLGASDVVVIGGLLPASDAGTYYFDALNVLEGKSFMPGFQLRPLFPGFLSAVLWLTQRNLQISIATLVAIVAICCFSAAREIQKIYGTLVAAIVLFGLFLFYRPYIGITMTETLGLALGALGFAALLRAIRTEQVSIAAVGMFLLAFAMNSRPGALFVLPGLLLWGAYVFRKSARFSWTFLLGGSSATLLAFILNSVLIKVVGSSDSGPPFGNYAFVLYGIITQTNWTHILQDHPEFQQLPLGQQMQRGYAIVFSLIKEDPGRLGYGILRGWQTFFFDKGYSLFADNLNFENASSNPYSNLEHYLRPLCVIGLSFCFWYRRYPYNSLLLVCAFGIVASVPFVPLGDSGIRAHAVTIIVHYLLAALGIALIVQTVKKLVQAAATLTDSNTRILRSKFFVGIPLLTLFSFPIWYQIFTVPTLHIQAQLSAPNIEFIRIYWDNPQQHPTAYVKLMIKQDPKNPASALLGDEQFREYEFSIIRTPWQKLEFAPEGVGKVQVKSITVNRHIITADAKGNFVLPEQFWNRKTAAIFATGICFLVSVVWVSSRLNKRPNWFRQTNHLDFSHTPKSDSFAFLIFGICIAALSFVGPISLKLFSHPMQLPSNAVCPANAAVSLLHIDPAASIHLVEDDIPYSRVPNIRISDFREGLKSYGEFFPKDVEGLSMLKPSSTIINSGWGFLAANTSIFPKHTGPILACGIPKRFGQYFYLIQATSIQRLNE